MDFGVRVKNVAHFARQTATEHGRKVPVTEDVKAAKAWILSNGYRPLAGANGPAQSGKVPPGKREAATALPARAAREASAPAAATPDFPSSRLPKSDAEHQLVTAG